MVNGTEVTVGMHLFNSTIYLQVWRRPKQRCLSIYRRRKGRTRSGKTLQLKEPVPEILITTLYDQNTGLHSAARDFGL